jgi:glycyl-tRNA synthetase beta chain
MGETRDLLIELGTEEMPAEGLPELSLAFRDNLCAGFEKQGLAFSAAEDFATPRRLAVLVRDLDAVQADREEVRRGPALDKAFDAGGQPTKAALGFAGSCGVTVEDLQTIDNGKGQWLGYTQLIRGRKTTELLESVITDALAGLPIRKRMRWSDHDFEFVRPVHWLAAVYGNATVELEIMNIRSGNVSHGHRFHAGQAIVIDTAARYAGIMRDSGKVIVDFAERRNEILRQAEQQAATINGVICNNPRLLDEITGLVEWPVALAASFDTSFLELPREVLIATMEKHQKAFAVEDHDGNLLPGFIAISNLESREPATVIHGNEKVLHPRLSDAAFFWQRDLSKSLDDHGMRLEAVLYQEQLGSMAAKSRRISALAAHLAEKLGLDIDAAARAGSLCKCDLVTDMVGEFPELQGTMGKYYARGGKEPDLIAVAIEEHYLPRYAGDALPESDAGRVVALADKLDTLVGIFSIGQSPTGDKDPFGLRRAALGVLRILIEKQLDLDLMDCLKQAATLYTHAFDIQQTTDTTFDYMMDRLHKYYLDQGTAGHVFDAVFARRPSRPLDFDRRIRAVTEFNCLAAAEHLAAANKRIRNILKQSAADTGSAINESLLEDPREQTLFSEMTRIRREVAALTQAAEYNSALQLLSGLQPCIDDFFDHVLVMHEDPAIQQNRIALLKSVSDMFLAIADISRLSINK